MTHRIIPCTYPTRVLDHIRACGCIARTEETEYRGPIAFIGEGRVWAVADLINVKPVGSRAKDDADKLPAFLWCFEGLREVEAIPCANIEWPGMFTLNGNLEPLFLQASAQAALNALLSPQDASEQPQTASGVSVPIQEPETPKLAESRALCAQLELF